MSNIVAKWLKLSLVALMGCGFLAMMIYALVNRDAISSSNVEPPLITPPAEPLKRRPDQPGGMQIPNRDKLVFDLLDSSATRVAATDVPPVEEVSAAVVAASGTVAVASSSTPVAAPSAAVVAEPVKSGVVTLPALQPAKVEAVKVEPAKVEEAKVAPKVEEKPAAKPVEKVIEKPAEKTVAAKGGWGVQLAAVSSEKAGKDMAAKAQKEFAALAKLTPRIQPVNGGKAYRVQLLGVADRDAAAKVCASLKGKMGCFPVSK